MATRIAKLPIIACACLVAGVVIGLVLAPRARSRCLRSTAKCGPVGLRRLLDRQRPAALGRHGADHRREINAYPEAEPIFSGACSHSPDPGRGHCPARRHPRRRACPAAAPPARPLPGAARHVRGAVPSGGSRPRQLRRPFAGFLRPWRPAGSVPARRRAGPAPVPSRPARRAARQARRPGGYPTPVGAVGEIDPLLPLEVDIDGQAIFEHGNEITVVVKSKVGAACELTVRWPDATEAPQPPMIADARGRCSFRARVPSTVPIGLGFMKGSVARRPGEQHRPSSSRSSPTVSRKRRRRPVQRATGAARR